MSPQNQYVLFIAHVSTTTLYGARYENQLTTYRSDPKINKTKMYRAKQKRAVFCSLFRLKASKERAHRLYIPAVQLPTLLEKSSTLLDFQHCGMLVCWNQQEIALER